MAYVGSSLFCSVLRLVYFNLNYVLVNEIVVELSPRYKEKNPHWDKKIITSLQEHQATLHNASILAMLNLDKYVRTP